MTQKITILGSTGSIGRSTLDVLRRHQDKFSVFALTGATQVDLLAQQCIEFQPRFAVMTDSNACEQLEKKLYNTPTQVLHGAEALCTVSAHEDVDMVMASIVGSAGLQPALASARAGKTILLANKETLVMAGQLFMETVQKYHATVLPVDSEHNAIFQVLAKDKSGIHASYKGVESIILTASGGPFWNTPLDNFKDITPEQAVAHPNWSMGRKISIDSATMMNKGLEVIEAHWLFNMSADKIEVLVHPQSIVHSMVRYKDGSVLAELGTPDMRTPIAYCLGLPERLECGVTPLDFTRLDGLTFKQPDQKRFPCLGLAFEVLRQEGDASCVLNAGNEVAVEAFLQNKIKFTDIIKVIEKTLERSQLSGSQSIDLLCEKDQITRQIAWQIVADLI